MIDFCQCNAIKGKNSLGAITNGENCTFVFNPDNPPCQKLLLLLRPTHKNLILSDKNTQTS